MSALQQYRNAVFYALKPIIPRTLQLRLRRAAATWKRQRFQNVWPIDERAAAVPQGWPGWPEGKRFALVLTHDVDTARGQDRCLDLAEIEKGLGFRSSFNFVPRRYASPAELRNKLVEMGNEVGVHGLYHDGKYFLSLERFRKRAKLIDTFLRDWKAVGFRAPSMLHNLEWIGHLGIDYDASTFDTDPFEPQSDGVRTIFPFLVSRPNGHAPYVELPYTLPQDFTLFILLRCRDITIWKEKLAWIASRGGMALMLTHPDYMTFDGLRPGSEEYPAAFYREFLEHVRTVYGGCYWHALPREVAMYCRAAYPVLKERPRRKIRACMLTYSFYENDGRVRRYAEALARRGDEVEVVSLRLPEQEKSGRIRGVSVYRIQKRVRNEQGKLDYLGRLVKFFAKSTAFVTWHHLRKPYDLIHVHSVPDFEVFAATWAKLAGAKMILDIHDIVPEFYANKFCAGRRDLLFKLLLAVERFSTHFADHVIISNDIWRSKLTARSVKSEKCTTFLNYPDESLFHPRLRHRCDDRVVILYPGTLNRHQGIDVAIRAMAILKDKVPNAEFHIYGSGERRLALERLAEELKLNGRVIIKDAVPIHEIPGIMAEADLGVVPKLDDSFGGEAFSTKIPEFMHLGVPVVCSATKIDRFYFSEEVVRFFRPGDEKDLAEALQKMIEDERMRKQMAERARVFARGFSWELRKQQYLDLVDRLVGVDRQ